MATPFIKIGFLCFLVFFVAINSIAGPRLVCDTPTYDFGSVVGREAITNVFRLKNTGDEPVVVANIKNCCGVESVVEPTTIPPGSNAVCVSVFNTRNRHGPQDKQVLLATNVRKQPYFELKLIGTLLKPVEVSPRYLRLGELIPESEINLIITATNLLEQPVVLESVQSTVPGIVSEVVGRDADGIFAPRRDWEIQLHANEPLKVGKLSGQVRLNFSTGTVNLPVIGEVRPLIRAVPDQLHLSSKSGKAVERLVMLRSSDGSAFEVINAELVDATGSVAKEKVAEGTWKLGVAIDPASVGRGARLRIETSRGLQPVVEVFLTSRGGA